jgi:hypothetical protein
MAPALVFDGEELSLSRDKTQSRRKLLDGPPGTLIA